jgi:DNA polymerase-3 subunit delta
MAVRADQLAAQLSRSLAPVYLLAGAEPLLIQESRDLVIQAAQAQGFVERTVHEVHKNFDWSRLSEDSAALSLFSSRKTIDVRLPTGRPGRDGSKALLELVDAADPDVLLLVTCEKWVVEIWPVKPHQLPQWIRGRMAAAGLEPEPEAIALLADLVEGNLLAAQQEIDKLLLLDQGVRISASDVAKAVANSARFDAFRLVECVLLGQLGECLRVASGLNRTNVAIQAVSGALYRELMLTDTVRSAIQSGEQESAVFGKLRIWPARQTPIKQALKRLSALEFGESFRILALIDRQSKGRAGGDPWQTLDRLLWYLCDPSAVKPA